MANKKIILGIDPGTLKTGYGLICKEGSSLTLCDYGVIRPPAKEELFDRYYILHQAIQHLIEQYAPTDLVVETQFMQKNVQSAMKLGMARGVAIIAGKAASLACYEYSPKEAKMAVVGSGNASKQQVMGMLKRLFHLKELPPEDAADALALALCHIHRSKR